MGGNANAARAEAIEYANWVKDQLRKELAELRARVEKLEAKAADVPEVPNA
jgi:BMFP domain-containing protein YqiC